MIKIGLLKIGYQLHVPLLHKVSDFIISKGCVKFGNILKRFESLKAIFVQNKPHENWNFLKRPSTAILFYN